MTLDREREAALDRVLRTSLVLDPPPDVRARILAGVLASAGELFAPQPTLATRAAPIPAATWSPVAGQASRPLSLAGYALLALVVALYAVIVGALSALGGPTGLVQQVVESVTLILGSPAMRLVPPLAERLAQYSAWLLLVPVVWYLWESDRAALTRT
jgi:hypothetical protein